MAESEPDWILVLADDLTGALEAGAKFALCGFDVRVTTDVRIEHRPSVEVLVVCTLSRHLPEGEARRLILRLADAAARFEPALVYKKTDSTLRGAIAAECAALQASFPDRAFHFAPAYPEMGRTVRNGILYLHGTPLHETEFANDLLNPVKESSVCALLRNDSILVLDAETAAHTTEAARRIVEGVPPPICAGPAALAASLAACLRPNASTVRYPPPRISPVLVVNGSLHPVARDQVAWAQQQESFFAHWVLFPNEVQGIGLERAAHLGDSVRNFLRAHAFEALIVFGGDTAAGIHRAFGSPSFQSLREILPGVPISRCGGLFWITKAGGFGDVDVLGQIQTRLL